MSGPKRMNLRLSAPHPNRAVHLADGDSRTALLPSESNRLQQPKRSTGVTPY
jgi:hypothetical protein